MHEIARVLVDQVWLWTSVAGLSVGLMVLLTSVAGLDWSPLLVMATVPVQRELLIGPDTQQLTITQVALAAFLAGAALRMASRQLSLRIDAVAMLTGAVLALYALSVLVADDVESWASETYRWVVAGIFLVIARNYFNPDSPRRILITLVAGIAAAATWSLAQVLFEQGPPSFVRSGLMRAHGAFGEPNPFAAFVWIITLPVIGYAVLGPAKSTTSRWISGIASVLGLSALALTQSRGGLLAVAAGLGVVFAALIVRQRPSLRIAGVLAVSIVSAVGLVLISTAQPWSGIDEMTTPGNWADQERTAHWAAAVVQVKQNPLTGVGAGGFSAHFRDATEFWRFRISRGHAHNAYLQVAAEIGLPGLLAYALLLATILGSLVRRSVIDRDRWLAIGVTAMSVALIVHQFVDYLHVMSLAVLFAGLWAAALPAGSKGFSSREHNIAS